MEPSQGPGPNPVVVGVDGSEGSAAALEWALDEARRILAPVRVVTAWAWGWGDGTTGPLLSPAQAVRRTRQTQEALVRAVVARFPGALPRLSTELVQGDAASNLIERSRDATLLVLGSRGVSGTTSPVGTVADTCLRHGACPVVIVRQCQGHDFPRAASPRNASLPPEPRSGLAAVAIGALGLL